MKKIIVLLVLVLAALSGASWSDGSAAAAPCYQGQNPDGSISCFHWGDTDRSNGTTVRTYVYEPFDLAFLTPINQALQDFNGSQGLIRTPSAQSGGYPASCDAGYLQAVNVCAQNFTTSCGDTPSGSWVGCADFVYWYEWNGSQWVLRPHLGRVRVRFDTAGTYYLNSNVPWTWDQEPNRRRQAACHEISGHGQGMTHTGSDPGSESCLRSWVGSGGDGVNFGSLNLGGFVTSQIVNNNNHNDPAQGQFGNTATAAPLKNTPSVLKLKRVQKGVYQLRKGQSAKGLGNLPIKILSQPLYEALRTPALPFGALKVKPKDNCARSAGRFKPLARGKNCGGGPIFLGSQWEEGHWYCYYVLGGIVYRQSC